MNLKSSKRLLLSVIKRIIYFQMSIIEGFKILLGLSKPYIAFTVEDDPPSVYLNFKIQNDQIDEFEKMLGLPDGFKLTRIRCLMEDRQDYFCLTLNVYRVSGVTNGLRAEWSVYVRDPQGRTRYMIVEARSDKGSMDPIDIITKKSRLEHAVKKERIKTYVALDDDTSFELECMMPDVRSTVMPTREWIEANDDIYWSNGVSDRIYYNGKMACSELLSIPAGLVKIKDTTKYSEFVEPEPTVVVYPSSIEFIISPWWNV